MDAWRGDDGYWRPFRGTFCETVPMTLVFALLREDHIIFGSDRRHVGGDPVGRYVNDDCWKTEQILDRRAMLGFAGHDFSEEIVRTLRRSGRLAGGTLRNAANAVAEAVYEKYQELSKSNKEMPTLEFLLAGFEQDNGIPVATCFSVSPPFLIANPKSFDPDHHVDNFVIIGKKRHGAMYVFYKCARAMKSVEAGIRLACFALAEVGKYDNSVGGRPQVCIIRPNALVDDRSENLDKELRWANQMGEEIQRIITLPG